MDRFGFKKSCVALSLLSALSVFAVGQPKKMPPGCAAPEMCAYNAPSCIDIGYKVYGTFNFTYWRASQQNIELGIVDSVGNALFDVDGQVKKQNFDFAPGFQIGFGTNVYRDNWDAFAEYTWFRNTDTVSASYSSAEDKEIVPLWGRPESTGAKYLAGNESWSLAMDFADAELRRTYFVGKELTFRPAMGIRAAFIRQYANVNYLDEASGGLSANDLNIVQKSHSWALGLRSGLYSSWLVGRGMRVYGKGYGDILFTQYTKLSMRQQTTTAAGALLNVTRVRESDVDALNAHLDLEIGFGWGSYFSNDRYHIDLSAGYGFQVFFNQNMFRNFSNDLNLTGSLSNGDLFVQGLTASLRFDF